jgi:hypothetical protein
MSEAIDLESGDETRIELAVAEYLRVAKNWKQGEFRVEIKGMSEGSGCAIVWAVRLEDESGPVPGAGRSVELQVDRMTCRILREFAFQ